MKIEELISSGIIEMYCMGMATDEEKALVEKFASESNLVRDEIACINEALQLYAAASAKSPSASLKDKILNAIKNSEKTIAEIQLPPRLTLASKLNDWIIYLSENNITTPSHYQEVFLLDLPSNEQQISYVAWARKGAVVEESHSDEDEYLLMVEGSCSVTIDGKIGYYKKGDVIYIPKNSLHRAEALSDEPMVLIGQRIAA